MSKACLHTKPLQLLLVFPFGVSENVLGMWGCDWKRGGILDRHVACGMCPSVLLFCYSPDNSQLISLFFQCFWRS